jgi:hypothetical protein
MRNQVQRRMDYIDQQRVSIMRLSLVPLIVVPREMTPESLVATTPVPKGARAKLSPGPA